MKTICIMCPMGCSLEITEDGEEIKVSGNSCLRGVEYGKNEIKNPVRIITSVIKLKNKMASVKTTNPIPKSKILDCQKEIAKIKVDDAKVGDIVLSNILGLNSNIVITGVFEV